MLNSKTTSRYLKASLNVFFNKKFFDDDKKLCLYDKFFVSNQNFCLFKNTFKVTLQNFFNVALLFNTVFYLKLHFKLKIDPKMCTFKNL